MCACLSGWNGFSLRDFFRWKRRRENFCEDFERLFAESKVNRSMWYTRRAKLHVGKTYCIFLILPVAFWQNGMAEHRLVGTCSILHAFSVQTGADDLQAPVEIFVVTLANLYDSHDVGPLGDRFSIFDILCFQLILLIGRTEGETERRSEATLPDSLVTWPDFALPCICRRFVSC